MKKTILVIFIICLITIFIYKNNLDNKLYYFNISDNKYKYETYNELLKKDIKKLEKYVNYENSDYRVIDLINDIEDNINIKDKTIQNILIKADIITLSIGNNELNYKMKTTKVVNFYNYIDELVNDIDKLFSLIRIYSKEKIFLLGFYTDNESYKEIISYLNIKLEDLCNKYKIVFIKLDNEFKIEENVNIYKKIKKKLLF